MRRTCRASKKRRAGVSLIEMMVSMALVGMIMLSTQALLSAAADYYKTSTMSLDVQQSLLTAMSKFCAEIGESSMTCIRNDDNPPGGVIFATPRGEDGKVRYGTTADGTNAGKVKWKRYLCYYVDTVNGQSCLIRREKTITETFEIPILAAGETTAAYQGSALPYRIVARNVTAFDIQDSTHVNVEMTAEDPRGRFFIKATSKVSPKN